MIQVQIIQPLVPEYRVTFFDTLARQEGLKIQIYASETLPGTSSIKSVQLQNDFIHLNHPYLSFLKHRLFWQKGLHIDKNLQSGDVLVISGNPRFLSNYPLIWEAKHRHIGVVWWGHGRSSSSTSITAAIRRSIMSWMDIILLYTNREVEEYKQLGFPPDKLFATNNAIDQKPIQQAIQAWPVARLEEFKVQNHLCGKKILLFCGRVTAKTQLRLVLEALVNLSKLDDNYLLVIIGEGEEKQTLMRYANTLDIAEHLFWIGSLFDQEKMAPWFLSAECFVYPGAIGLSLIHAFNYGLPVITHGNMANQMPEIAALREGENGLLFRENDVDDLVAKILFLANHPEERSKMSKLAYDTVDKEFSMENMVKRFVEAIHTASQRVKAN